MMRVSSFVRGANWLVRGAKLDRKVALACLFGCLSLLVLAASTRTRASAPASGAAGPLQLFLDSAGVIATYDANGPVDKTNPFFQSLGTNGRSCSTCHIPAAAMSFTPGIAQFTFATSRGKDPLFASVDGANCPNARTEDPSEHSLILQNGLIRIAITLPTAPQFTIQAIHDPYGCAISTDSNTDLQTVSVYRRPLPSTNLNFLSTVMFDGRETIQPLNSPTTFAANLITDLKHQSVDATTTHAQAANPPTDAQQDAMVNFELGLSSAQLFDFSAGFLNADGAQGGPFNLSNQQYYAGINDSLGHDPTGASFNPNAFGTYSAWPGSDPAPWWIANARTAIADGEKIFNSAPLTITDVSGLNSNNAALGNPASIKGTCTTCHDAPNVGDHSLPLPLDIGPSHVAAYDTDPQILAGLPQLRVPNLPVYEIDGCPDPQNPGQTKTIYTTDPGKGLVTGLCSDVNRVKGPILRGLAARAPYFHNGSAASLNDVVKFYEKRFNLVLTPQQEQHLIAFLNTL